MTASPEQVAPLRQRPAWAALERTTPRSASATCATCSPRTRTAASGCAPEAVGLYLDYSKNRVTDETHAAARPAGRGVRTSRSAGT